MKLGTKEYYEELNNKVEEFLSNNAVMTWEDYENELRGLNECCKENVEE